MAGDPLQATLALDELAIWIASGHAAIRHVKIGTAYLCARSFRRDESSARAPESAEDWPEQALRQLSKINFIFRSIAQRRSCWPLVSLPGETQRNH